MPLDPNWFYSSLAQCAAALVGLLGAVLATRLQQQLSDVRASFQHIAKLLSELRESLGSRASQIQSYIPFADDRMRAIETALNRGEARLQVNQEVSFWGGSSSGSPWLIDATHDAIAEYKRMRAAADPAVSMLQKYRSLSTVDDAVAADFDLARLHDTLPPAVAQGVIPALRVSIDVIRAADAAHRRIASVAVSATFATILAWLCVFGLIGPLWYLSAREGPSRVVFLLAFGVGVIAIPGYIGVQLLRIVRLRSVVALSSAT